MCWLPSLLHSGESDAGENPKHNAGCMRRYLADLVISYLQDVLAAAVLGVGHSSHAMGGHTAALPPPMFPGNGGVPDALCFNPGHDFKVLVTSHEVRSASQTYPHKMVSAVGCLVFLALGLAI